MLQINQDRICNNGRVVVILEKLNKKNATIY